MGGSGEGGMDGWKEAGGFALSLCDCGANRPWAVIMWTIWSCHISKLYCFLIDGLNTPTVFKHAHTHTQHLHPESPKCMQTHTHRRTLFGIWWEKQHLENEEQRWGLWCSDKGCNFNFTPCHSPQYLLWRNTYELPITHAGAHTQTHNRSVISAHANFGCFWLPQVHKDKKVTNHLKLSF